ncbi:putative 5'3'-deoxyribonucleotidase protein [Rhizobium phage RHph_I4]|nr:putative 5'3'-deoxyribonucleotidase protein [Rhizobium phage RHph_I4]
MTRRIFLDLDGVMADFDTHFYNCFGCHPPSKGGVSDDELWRLVHGHGSFFRTMPIYDGAKRFFDTLVQWFGDVIILTAASKLHYHDMARQKRAWVRERLTTDHLILPVQGGSAKPLFMHAPGDVLIDDWRKNCERWRAEGGTAIEHTDFATTSVRLGMIWGMDSKRKSQGLPFQPVYTEEDFTSV